MTRIVWLQAAAMPDVICLSLDPGTVNTKILRTGWDGCFGIPLAKANDTFWLATDSVWLQLSMLLRSCTWSYRNLSLFDTGNGDYITCICR